MTLPTPHRRAVNVRVTNPQAPQARRRRRSARGGVEARRGRSAAAAAARRRRRADRVAQGGLRAEAGWQHETKLKFHDAPETQLAKITGPTTHWLPRARMARHHSSRVYRSQFEDWSDRALQMLKLGQLP